MRARDFCYWLQGYFEIRGDNVPDLAITPNQVKLIRNHLNMVFVHEIDPSYGPQQQQLQKTHAGLGVQSPSSLAEALGHGAHFAMNC